MLRLNTDVSPANVTPGIKVQILTSGASGADANEPNTLLLMGEMFNSGSWAPGGVYSPSSEQDVIDGAGGGTAGAGAPTILRQYRAAIAQVGEGGVRVRCVPVLGTGTAATYRLTVAVPGTNPTIPGTLRYSIAGDEVAVAFTTSDTAATIATALLAELNKLKNVCATFGLSTATITITYNVSGALGEDMPQRCNITQGSGVYLSPVALRVSTTANGAGSVKLFMGAQTCTAAVSNSDTAAMIAAAVKTALAADDFPLLGGTVVNTSDLPLYMRNDRTLRRVSAAVVTTADTTVRMYDFSGGSTIGAVTDGTGSASSKSYAGTQGSGLPSLATALANVSNAGSAGEWTAPWVSAGSGSTGLSAIATQIEAEADGNTQKNQHLTVCSVDSETTAAALAASCTPVLGGSLRYIIGHCPDAGVQGYELAARRAAMIAAWSTPATNSDAAFGGTPFKTRGSVPLLLPDLRVRASAATTNTAILDGLEPWGVTGGQLVVIRGRNTSTATERELWDPSYIRITGEFRRDLQLDGSTTFVDARLKADGIATQANEVTTASIEGWAIGRMDTWERRGLYDGAAQLKSGVKAEINQSDRTRADLVVPSSPVIMMHQLCAVLARSAPTLS